MNSSNATDAAAMMEAGAMAQMSKDVNQNLGCYILGSVVLNSVYTVCLSDVSFTLDYVLFGVMVHQAMIWAPNIPSERKFVVVVAVSSLRRVSS